ncbi:LysR family transcriptional regulator [Burkholderia sp. Ac-20353]|uniref:LysR family transcriptional regulator n=1 Tax=Burkholderia sp. Ac-20353 TaxID=2703894 RepID=UPI00197C91E4|nr:LysR family transcriptional regulator [Burkholderia sp. Ac-20353]MBN3785971.1 LysR family transcriptional regulator [Burkholderia sp. Ac-20353]
MHIFRTDLNLLVVLDRIYTQQSITRAAQQLNLSQSAVSHALNRLRELLGDPLFERHGNAMVPTPFTRAIIARVRDGLHTLECTLHESSRFDAESANRRFTLGVLNAHEPVVLPPIMQYVTQHAPSVDVAAIQHDRRTIEADLLTGSLDAVIDVLLPHPQSVCSARLATDKYVVLCRRDHPRVGQHLDLGAYLAEEHVLVTSRRRGGGVEDSALVKLGAERRVRLRCIRYFAACRVINQTDLLLTMPERYARLLNQLVDNQMIECPFDASIDTYLYWHANSDADPANVWLRQRLRAIFESAHAEAAQHL